MATSIPGDNYSLTSFANLFKRVFVDERTKEDLFYFDNELLKLIKVEEGFTGTDEERLRATSLGGGYGFSGTMPRVNESGLIRPRLEAKKFHARALLDTESIAAAMDNKGAFDNLVNRVKMDLKRQIDQGLSLALFCSNADGDVLLGTIAASSGVSGSNPYVLTLSDFHRHKFHVKQIVNIETGNTDPFEVTSIDESAGTITVSRLSGSQIPANSDEIYLQNSEAAGFIGLPGALAASGTLYNVTISEANKWAARRRDLNNAAIDENILYEELINIKDRCGEYPDLIVASKTQYLKIAEFLSDKRVLSGGADKDMMGHGALSIMGPAGPVRIIWDRLQDEDQIYVLNSKRIMLRKRPMSGLVEQGGSVLLPNYIVDDDSFLIHYRLYGNFYIEPTFHGVILNCDI